MSFEGVAIPLRKLCKGNVVRDIIGVVTDQPNESAHLA